MVGCKLIFSFILDIGERLVIDKIENFNHRLATYFTVFKCVRCRLKRPKSTVKPKDDRAYNSHQISVKKPNYFGFENSYNCNE